MLTEGVSYLKCPLAGPFLIISVVRRNNPSQITSNCVSISCICTVKQTHRCNNQEPNIETQSASHFLASDNQRFRSKISFKDSLISEITRGNIYIYSLSKMSSAKTDDDPPRIGMHQLIECLTEIIERRRER
jgi:hypothetical protein